MLRAACPLPPSPVAEHSKPPLALLAQRPLRAALLGFAVQMLALGTVPAAASAQVISGAAILEHPIGTLALRHMALVHAGKIEEAVALGNQSMQADWRAMPEKDRAMMSEMLRAFSLDEATFRADITGYGILSIDGERATLVIRNETDDASGKGSSTLTQRFAREGGAWKLANKR